MYNQLVYIYMVLWYQADSSFLSKRTSLIRTRQKPLMRGAYAKGHNHIGEALASCHGSVRTESALSARDRHAKVRARLKHPRPSPALTGKQVAPALLAVLKLPSPLLQCLNVQPLLPAVCVQDGVGIGRLMLH